MYRYYSNYVGAGSMSPDDFVYFDASLILTKFLRDTAFEYCLQQQNNIWIFKISIFKKRQRKRSDSVL